MLLLRKHCFCLCRFLNKNGYYGLKILACKVLAGNLCSEVTEYSDRCDYIWKLISVALGKTKRKRQRNHGNL